MNIAINGFGRIGRLTFRAIYEQGLLGKEINVVAVNDIVPAENLAYLLKYDTMHGPFPGNVRAEGEELIIDDQIRIKSLMLKDGPLVMPWQDLNIDVVIESTGLFTKKADASGHLTVGARRVLITAPSPDADITAIYGVNQEAVTPEHKLVSAASCTTNCIVPLLHVLEQEGISITEALMTTIHSYTAPQLVVDGPHKKNFRLGRNAANNLIPSTTGAAEAIVQALPYLQGKITGMSIRVPTPNVSLVDLTVKTGKETSLEEIASLMQKASTSYLQGVLAVTSEPVVSSDFNHDTYSSVLDTAACIELNPTFFKLIAWYDNEWGYSNRLVDLLRSW